MEKTKEESLTNVRKQSIFNKIKKFFQKIFTKREQTENTDIEIKTAEEEKNAFKESIKNTEDTKTELLKLQERFKNGEIKEGELSQEQIDKLCELYDMQIESLKLSIEIRKKKIEEYRKKNRK